MYRNINIFKSFAILIALNFFRISIVFGQGSFGAPIVVGSEWWHNSTPIFMQNMGPIVASPTPAQSVTIQGSSQVSFVSGSEINLMPGFEVSALSGDGFFHGYIDENMSDVEVVAMNALPPNYEIGEFEKLELGIKTPGEINSKIEQFFATCDLGNPNGNPYPPQAYDESIGLNPYNYGDLIVQGIFTSPSGQTQVIDGFFYREAIYNKNESDYHKCWTEVPTDYHFRIRFAPSEIGKWTCLIRMSSPTNSFNSLQSGPYYFYCISSQNKGYVEIGQNKTNFRFSKTNDSYFPIGLNTPSPSYYLASGDQLRKEDVQPAVWNAVANNGGNIVSLPFIMDEYGFEWEYLGVYDKYNFQWKDNNGNAFYWSGGNRQYQAHAVDELFDLAHEQNLYLKVWVTPHQHWGNGSSDCVFNQGPYNTSGNDLCAFFSSPILQQKYLNYCRYMIARWGYSTNIAWWEIMSEIDNIGCFNKNDLNSTESQSVLTFEHLLYCYFKSKDPNHLASASCSNSSYNDDPNYNDDFYNLHKYGISENLNRTRAERVGHFINKPDNQKRPVIYGEAAEDIAELNGKIEGCDRISFHNMLWATTMMGCAGSGLNWYWAPLYYAGYFSEMGPLSSFMEGIDFESTKYISNEYKLWPLESFQMRDDNKTLGMGWVHDRTYYWYSVTKAHDTWGTCLGELDHDGGDPSDVQTCSDYIYNNVAINGFKSSFWRQHYYNFSWYYTSINPPLSGIPYYYGSSTQGTNWLGEIRLITPLMGQSYPDWAYKLNYIGTDKSVQNSTETTIITPVIQNDNIKITPNPSNGTFVIETNINHINLIVRDIHGNCLYTCKTQGQQHLEINLKNYSEGMYILTLCSETNCYNQKLIIIK